MEPTGTQWLLEWGESGVRVASWGSVGISWVKGVRVDSERPKGASSRGRMGWLRARVPAWLILVGLIVGFAAGGSTATDPAADDAAALSTATVSAEPSALPVSSFTPEPSEPATVPLRDQLIEALGEGNRNMEKVGLVGRESGLVSVQFAIDDNLTGGLIADGARRDVLTILQVALEAGNPFRDIKVSGTFSMQDEYGNAFESQVVRVVFSWATVRRINFENVDPDRIYELATVASLHPEFE